MIQENSQHLLSNKQKVLLYYILRWKISMNNPVKTFFSVGNLVCTYVYRVRDIVSRILNLLIHIFCYNFFSYLLLKQGRILFLRSKNVSKLPFNFHKKIHFFTANCQLISKGPFHPFILCSRFLQYLEIWSEKSGWKNLVREIWLEKSG